MGTAVRKNEEFISGQIHERTDRTLFKIVFQTILVTSICFRSHAADQIHMMDPNLNENCELAVALIRRMQEDGTSNWLLKRHPSTQNWGFIQTQRLERESPRQAVARETSWQLGLDGSIDFLVANMALLHLPSSDPPAAGYENWQITEASFFVVDLYGRRSQRHCDALPDVYWASSAEICSGKLLNGGVLHHPDHQLIQRSEVIQPWH